MRNYFSFLLLLSILFACTNSTKQIKSNSKNLTNRNHFPNVIKVEQFGDSMRLEVERKGFALIKHYIDLKGTKDDGFDNSYNVTCNYETIKNDTTINSNCFFIEGDYIVYFNQKQIMQYCDSIIQHLKDNDWDREVVKPPYEELKKYAIHKSNSYPLDKMQELFFNMSSKLVDSKSKEVPKSILVEFYKTEFSAGKNFYIISNKGDTTEWFHQMDYMN